MIVRSSTDSLLGGPNLLKTFLRKRLALGGAEHVTYPEGHISNF